MCTARGLLPNENYLVLKVSTVPTHISKLASSLKTSPSSGEGLDSSATVQQSASPSSGLFGIAPTTTTTTSPFEGSGPTSTTKGGLTFGGFFGSITPPPPTTIPFGGLLGQTTFGGLGSTAVQTTSLGGPTSDGGLASAKIPSDDTKPVKDVCLETKTERTMIIFESSKAYEQLIPPQCSQGSLFFFFYPTIFFNFLMFMKEPPCATIYSQQHVLMDRFHFWKDWFYGLKATTISAAQ